MISEESGFLKEESVVKVISTQFKFLSHENKSLVSY
jgi:hypothetical protein